MSITNLSLLIADYMLVDLLKLFGRTELTLQTFEGIQFSLLFQLGQRFTWTC